MAATLIGFTGFASGAEPPEPPPLLSMWDAIYTARTGAGYKDNVFLAHSGRERSPFVSAGAEIIVLRVAAVGPQFSLFTGGDVNQFLSICHTEATAFAQAQLEQDFGDSCKVSLAAEYFFQDQIVDLSVSETNQQAVLAFGHTLSLRPGVRQILPRQFWLSVETPATRQFFDAPLDDYWDAAPKLTVGRSYGHDSQLALSYEALWRFYDTEFASTASGAAITNNLRERFQQEVRIKWRHHWNEQKRWLTTMTVGGRFNEENGGGYFDYTTAFASAQIRYRARPWEISVESRAAFYDYAKQTASATDLSSLWRTDWSVAVHLERQLGKHFTLLVSFEHEQTESNDPLETYSANTISGSVQWEF